MMIYRQTGISSVVAVLGGMLLGPAQAELPVHHDLPSAQAGLDKAAGQLR